MTDLIFVYLNLTTNVLKVFPFSNKLKSFVLNHFVATCWKFVSVSLSAVLLMVLEAFQLKLLGSSWPPVCYPTACILPSEALSSRSKVIAPYTVSKGSLKPSPRACLDMPHHPCSRHCIQPSDHHAVLSGIKNQHGCMPDRASVFLYHWIFPKSGIWRGISLQKYLWPQAVRSFLPSPGQDFHAQSLHSPQQHGNYISLEVEILVIILKWLPVHLSVTWNLSVQVSWPQGLGCWVNCTGYA